MAIPVTNFNGCIRSGSSKGSDIGTPILVMKASFDPTSSDQVLLFTLPANSIPLPVIGIGGATGGTNPTVDIGTVASNAGFANELDADALYTTGTGVLTGVPLTVDTQVYGKVGASAADGGTVTVLMQYVMSVGVQQPGTRA